MTGLEKLADVLKITPEVASLRLAKILPQLAQVLLVTPEDAALLLAKVLTQATERESEIITFRFGLDEGILRTLEETCEACSSTREQVRQIEQKALARMRHPLFLTD